MSTSTTRSLFTAWLQRPVAVIAWATALLLGGMWAARQVPLEWVPQVELPEVTLRATWQGAAPRQVERYVTAPLERAVQGVPGTERIESYSEEGSAFLRLKVSRSADLGLYTAQVNERLSMLRGVLPDRVVPRLDKQVPQALRDEQGFMTLQLVGPLTPDALRALADDRLAPRFSSLPGVASVRVEGGTQRELLITLHPDQLDAYGVHANEVQTRLAEAMRDASFGRLRGGGRATLLTSEPLMHLAEIRRLVVGTSRGDGPARAVRLEQVADAEIVPAPIRSISRIDGMPVVTLVVDRAPGSHMLEVAGSVHERIDELRASLPADTRLLVADDRSESVREQLNDLARRGGLGLLLIVIVLFGMLKSSRAVAIVLFSVSVALAVALAMMGWMGFTLNLITIAGLVLVFGLLIDNAVIVVEQLMLQRSRLRRSAPTAQPVADGRSDVYAGGDRSTESAALAGAAEAAVRAVWLPLLGGTLSTMAVLIPLVYLSGELRELFLPFGVLVCLTLAVSLVSAAVLVPVLGRFLPSGHAGRPTRIALLGRRLVAAPYRLPARFPKSTLLALFLLLGIPIWLLPARMDVQDAEQAVMPRDRVATLYNATLGSSKVRDAREWLDPALGGVMRRFARNVHLGQRWSFQARPEVSARVTLPPGSEPAQADSIIWRLEQVALASPAVRRTIANVTGQTSTLRVQFHEDAFQTIEPYLVRERMIQRAIRFAGITISVGGLLPQAYFSGSGGMVSGMRVQALGPNYEDLENLAESFAQRLRRNARVAEVNTNAGRFGGRPDRLFLRLPWDADAAARSGASALDLASTLRPTLAARTPVQYADLDGGDRLQVRIVSRDAETLELSNLVMRPLAVNDSARVRLSGLSAATVEQMPEGIERENQQYKRYLAVDYRGPFQMAYEFLDRELAAMPVPPGYRLERSTGTFFTRDVQSAFGRLLLATLLLVFLITAAIFESWRLPLVVMFSVPMAAIGVGAGFLWTGANFAEGAFIGVVLLVGIAVNDSILLVDRFRQYRLRRPHGDPGLLARLAVRERLRPMWTTTLSTIAGMLPLLVIPGRADFWLGLSVTVVGGLLAATLLAPFVTVAALSLGRRPKTKPAMRLPALSFVLLLAIAACSGDQAGALDPVEAFFEKEPQAVDERVITATLYAVDSLNLSDYGAYRVGQVRTDSSHLFLALREEGMVLAIDKRDPTTHYRIGHGIGEGPGEVLGLTDFVVSDEHLIAYTSSRIMKWTKTGELLYDRPIDLRPSRVRAVDADAYVMISPESAEYLFAVLDAEANVRSRFQEVDFARYSPLYYAGRIATSEGDVYYAGYSEPIIKRYGLDGRVKFSVSTINDHPSEVNYVHFESGDMGVLAYSEHALLSTLWIEVQAGYCFVVPIHDVFQTLLAVIDVYDAEDGRYVESYELAQSPRSLAVENGWIYTVELHGEDYFVKRYPNPAFGGPE